MDVDELADLAAGNDVRAMPTFHFFKKGVLHDTLQGADPSALGTKIESNHVRSWGGGYRLGDPAPTTITTPSPVVTNTTSSEIYEESANEVLLSNLMDMGFNYTQVELALSATGNAGLEQAIDWFVFILINLNVM